jgi:hypothetical protein
LLTRIVSQTVCGKLIDLGIEHKFTGEIKGHGRARARFGRRHHWRFPPDQYGTGQEAKSLPTPDNPMGLSSPLMFGTGST